MLAPRLMPVADSFFLCLSDGAQPTGEQGGGEKMSGTLWVAVPLHHRAFAAVSGLEPWSHHFCFLHLNLQRPIPLVEVKVSPPKFDLAATNFPPLPGCVVSTQGEPVLENRMSDVVRGLFKVRIIWFCLTWTGWVVRGLNCRTLCFLKTEQTSKEATVTPGSGQTQTTEEAVAVSSPALTAPKSVSQPLGSLASRYDPLIIIWFQIFAVESPQMFVC